MPEVVKTAINNLSIPWLVIGGATVLLFVCLRYYKELTRPSVSIAVAVFFTIVYALSFTDENFRSIVAKPDNIPITMVIYGLGFCGWWAFRQAAINDERIARGEPPVEATEGQKAPVWPDLVYTEFVALILCTAFLFVWGILLKAPLEQPADPSIAPNPSKAPWYFLGLQEMLVYYDPWIAGVLLPGLIIVGLMAIPFIDTNPKGSGYYTFAERKMAISMFMFGFIILWVLLVVLGTFLRGPNWNFFGPYEKWDIHKLEPLNNVNLSEYIWVIWTGKGLPDNILLRELPGILLVLLYLGAMPLLMAKTFFRKVFEEIGPIRYHVFAFLFLMMMSLPIKMLLRWTMNLKYVVAIPEFFFNI